MQKIKKNDIVGVIKGKDKGKRGRVLEILSEKNRVLVEGINLLKKHKRKTQNDTQGGIVTIESPVAYSNILPLCKHCNRPVRVGFMNLKDGTKSRICKICKEIL